jgi:hypothetical protein
MAMEKEGVRELLYQALETELGGVEVYATAIRCARDEGLKEEWTKYHEQTERHVQILRGVFDSLGLDLEATTPGRLIVREKGKALVAAMRRALKDAPEAAQVVAAECVVDAETKDHRNWELIGAVGEKMTGEGGEALIEAYEQVEDEEDEHLYHTMGWCRELWLETLGLPAVMPPPEEKEDVESALEEAKVNEKRTEAVKRNRRKIEPPEAKKPTVKRPRT